MNKLFKKAISILMVSAMVVSIAACGNSSTTAATDTKAGDSSASQAPESKEQITLNAWAIWNNPSDSMTVPFTQVIENINKEDSNVKIKVDYTDNEAYKTKIKASVAANEAPDIYYVWGGGFLKPFVESGKVLQIDDKLTKEYKDKLLPGVTVNYTYDNKLYGLPTGQQVCHLYINKEIFDQNSLKVPTTYNELLEDCKALKAKGITPISLGAKDRWAVGKVFDMMGIRAMGVDKTVNLLEGKGTFLDDDFKNAANKFAELVKAGAFTENPVAITSDEALGNFTQGKSAMFYNGSWAVSVINAESSKVKGKVIAIPFPKMEDGKGTVTEFIGGASDGFVVNADTKYPTEAVDMMAKITSNVSEVAYQAGACMPTWKVNVDESKIDPLFKSISDDTKNATSYTIWWDTFFEGSKAQDYLYALIDTLMGNTTGDELADNLEKIIYKK
ncbi:MAG: extracellular solute-binding protein [Ruminiclostridium sp.]